MEMIKTLLYILVSLFLTVVAALKFSTNRKQKLNLPPSPAGTLPFLGHLHLIKSPVHRYYHHLSRKLGPIFSLQLGTRLVVVVSSPEAVEECFTKYDVVLANRPHTISGKYIGYNDMNLAGASYGEHWRNLRRITTLEIFGTARLNVFLSEREDEIRRLSQNLYHNKKSDNDDFVKVELRPLLTELTFNVIMRMVAGKRYYGKGEVNNEEAKRFRDLINEVLELGSINPADFLPVLRWINYKGCETNVKKIGEKMDVFLQGLIEEHRCSDKSTNTMIDRLLSLQESEPENYKDVIIKGIITVMLHAGADTSAVTIEWAMSALLNHPEKLAKARAEIDATVGKDRLVNESDLSKLQYLQHIISETYRLFPAVPLLLPHQSSEDCKIGGYDIPRGTILMVNAWAIHRDPSIWDDPESFKPERFESAGEVLGKTKMMPFGMGRRSCPGTGLAQRVVGLALASMIQCSEWKRIDDEEKLDMREGKGLTMPKAIPLEAMCKPRDAMMIRKINLGRQISFRTNLFDCF